MIFIRLVFSVFVSLGFVMKEPSFFSISKYLAFRLAILVFAKTRFCSHINFIGRCLHSKVIPKGFRSNFLFLI